MEPEKIEVINRGLAAKNYLASWCLQIPWGGTFK